jgi:hypothetical protein
MLRLLSPRRWTIVPPYALQILDGASTQRAVDRRPLVG